MLFSYTREEDDTEERTVMGRKLIRSEIKKVHFQKPMKRQNRPVSLQMALESYATVDKIGLVTLKTMQESTKPTC